MTADDKLLKAIAKNPGNYLIIGDLDKPFHLPECECHSCEHWRRQNGRPTRKQLRLNMGKEKQS